MSDQKENRNTWEEALGGLETPPLSASWKAMEGLLDREMPVQPRGRGWRWLLLLLLLLLIGVCNVYRGRHRGGQETATKPAERGAQGGGAAARGAQGGGAAVHGAQSEAAGTAERAAQAEDRGAQAEATAGTGRKSAGVSEKNGAMDAAEAVVKVGSVTSDGSAAVDGQGAQDAGGAGAITDSGGVKKDIVFAEQKTDSGKAKLDTTHPGSKITAKKEKKKEDPYRGFTAGIGLNQFFPVGPQVQSNFNSSGTNGTITDYLPVPQLRYFFSRKLYVEAEAQFNTPQYTSKNLLASQQVTQDSSNGNQQSSSVYIKKLFYFNLPVSVHYSPVKGLYVGAGLEYAKLTNGVADFSQGARFQNSTGGYYDTVLTSKIIAFKGDSIYQKLRTHEWRLLGDVDYEWKGFTLGLRYNWALNKFINLQVSGSQVTQARNSSLQLYLRYTIWRQRSIRKSPR